MLITTANDLPGYEITETLGEVFGLTVRSRNVGSQLGAGLKSLVGGELKGMTKALVDSRQQVIDRMVAEAEAKGGNAVVAMRFDTSEMGGNWTEICAYGTAVGARPLHGSRFKAATAASGAKRECFEGRGANDAEVAAVDRGDLRDTEPLGRGHDRRINRS